MTPPRLNANKQSQSRPSTNRQRRGTSVLSEVAINEGSQKAQKYYPTTQQRYPHPGENRPTLVPRRINPTHHHYKYMPDMYHQHERTKATEKSPQHLISCSARDSQQQKKYSVPFSQPKPTKTGSRFPSTTQLQHHLTPQPRNLQRYWTKYVYYFRFLCFKGFCFSARQNKKWE